MSKAIEIQILGQSYKLKSENGEEYVRHLATYVEAVVDEIRVKSPTHTARERIAVMAAIHIADDYMQMKRRISEKEEDAQEKVEAMIKASDKLLQNVRL